MKQKNSKLSQLLLRKVGSEERHKHNQAHPLHVLPKRVNLPVPLLPSKLHPFIHPYIHPRIHPHIRSPIQIYPAHFTMIRNNPHKRKIIRLIPPHHNPSRNKILLLKMLSITMNHKSFFFLII